MKERYLGIETKYIKTGKGSPTLVFLHGWGTDHACFYPVIDKLSEHFTIYALDLPGFGETEEPKEVFGVFEYAAFVKEFLHRNDIKDPVIIGHSNGGRIALALTQSMFFSKMVLIDSTGIKPVRKLSYYLKVYSYKFIKGVLGLFSQKLVEKYRKNKGSRDYRAASEKMKAVLKKVVEQDLRYLMPDIKTSTLLFWGEKDTATPLSDARLMNELIPDSGIVAVKGAGHYSFLEDTSLFIRVLMRFLED